MVPTCSGQYLGRPHRLIHTKLERYIYVGNRKHVQFKCPACGFQILRPYSGRHLRKWRKGPRPIWRPRSRPARRASPLLLTQVLRGLLGTHRRRR